MVITDTPIIDQFGNPIDSDAAGDYDSVIISIGGIAINDYSSYTYERDFFVPGDVFTLILEDDDIKQLLTVPFTTQFIAITGLTFQFIINGICRFNGFVYSAVISNSRSGGSKITITCKDALGVASDSCLPPQLHFDANTEYGYIMKTIFNDFGFTEDDQFLFEDDSGTLALSTGQEKSRLPKQARSSKNNPKKNDSARLSRLLSPYPNEGVMEFAKKICDRIGWNIKQIYTLKRETDIISFVSPIYDRASDVYGDYYLFRPSPYEGTLEEANSQEAFLVKEGSMHIDWHHQASVIVGECSGYGGNFYRSDDKYVAINEISGYNNDETVNDATQSIIDSWVTLDGIADNAFQLSKNEGLLKILKSNNMLPSPTIPINPFARPLFIYDQEAATQSELDYSMRKKLYTLQDTFFTLNYKVPGHSINGILWEVNTMIKVLDNAIDNVVLTGSYWIRKITMSRGRGNGTHTDLELKLPYIYDFEQTGPGAE